MKIYKCKNLLQTQAAGADILSRLRYPACVYLHGEMGVGKTTLCQAIIHAAGYIGAVTSPTYNLIHEYAVDSGTIYHADLYRLDDPGELEFLGLKDLWGPRSLFLIEWPDRGKGFLQAADFHLSIESSGGSDKAQRTIIFDSRN